MATDLSSLAARARSARRTKDWNQADLARQANVLHSRIARMEFRTAIRNPVTLEEIVRIADALECSLDYLVGRVEHPWQIIATPAQIDTYMETWRQQEAAKGAEKQAAQAAHTIVLYREAIERFFALFAQDNSPTTVPIGLLVPTHPAWE